MLHANRHSHAPPSQPDDAPRPHKRRCLQPLVYDIGTPGPSLPLPHASMPHLSQPVAIQHGWDLLEHQARVAQLEARPPHLDLQPFRNPLGLPTTSAPADLHDHSARQIRITCDTGMSAKVILIGIFESCNVQFSH